MENLHFVFLLSQKKVLESHFFWKRIREFESSAVVAVEHTVSVILNSLFVR